MIRQNLIYQFIGDLYWITKCEIKDLCSKKTIEWNFQKPNGQEGRAVHYAVDFNREAHTLLPMALGAINSLLLRSLVIKTLFLNLEEIFSLIKKSQQLEIIKIVYPLDLSSLWRVLGDSCPHLKSIELDLTRTSQVSLSFLRSCIQLQELHLSYSAVDFQNELIALLLARGRSLQKLVLYQCIHITELTLKSISNYCPQLRTLNLKGCQIDAESLSCFNGKNPSIKNFYCDGLVFEEADIMESDLFSSLEELSLTDSSFEKHSLPPLEKKMPYLRYLNLSGSSFVSLDELSRLLSSPANLKVLELTNCSLSTGEILELKNNHLGITIIHDTIFSDAT